MKEKLVPRDKPPLISRNLGLEAQLLSVVVGKERPDLEEEKDSLVTNIAAGWKLLKNLEDEILRLLNETEGSLLDDVHLVNTLKTSKATSISVKEQLEISEKTEIEIDSARELYRPCAERASILFFVLNDFSHIDPMYQFSLDSYFKLFVNSISKNWLSEDSWDNISELDKIPGFHGLISSFEHNPREWHQWYIANEPENTPLVGKFSLISDKKSNLEERIQTLNDYHTYAVYR
ncbi:hypothetical protein J437_LFUL000477 [Ladona fulva]|uniref:Dynein heavy chain ATP-binding dynein motor region domain-containing protein n=1 Tax=Ladona fulva TaxID=123851 RepID=A0A8K0KKS7_LADFU|nr:hypothetical protein J437_LFUL000477 [Ladona fulva]